MQLSERVIESSPTDSDSNNSYWIDPSAQTALATIVSCGIYNCLVIDNATSLDQPQEELIRVNEIQTSSSFPIAMYISKCTSYTEKDCRAICRKLVNCIKIMHDAGLAHRYLHLGNVLTDTNVRQAIFSYAISRQYSSSWHSTTSILIFSILRGKLPSRVSALLNSFVKINH
jgi:hypothetical protein